MRKAVSRPFAALLSWAVLVVLPGCAETTVSAVAVNTLVAKGPPPTAPAEKATLEFEDTSSELEQAELSLYARYPRFFHSSPAASKALNGVARELVDEYERLFKEFAANPRSSGEVSLKCEVTVATPALAGFVCFGLMSVSRGETSTGDDGGAPGGPNVFAHLLAIDAKGVRELKVKDILNDGNLTRVQEHCMASGDASYVCMLGVQPMIALVTEDSLRLYRQDWSDHHDVPFDEVPGGVRADVLKRAGWPPEPALHP